MRIIFLKKEILLDEEDYAFFLSRKWHITKTGYLSSIERVAGKDKSITFSRVVLNASKDMQVDHINRNRLDNRKENLRLCTAKQNTYNTNSRLGVTGYRGVTRNRNGRYIATLRRDGVAHQLRGFRTAYEAAIARDFLAKKYHGEFARLNFPEKAKVVN